MDEAIRLTLAALIFCAFAGIIAASLVLALCGLDPEEED